jgi:hypothetical protein
MFQDRFRPVATVLVAAVCVLMTGAGLYAKQTARATAAPQADANGFKVGEVVDVDTAFGWTDATIVAMNGNNYQVKTSQGITVMKAYPLELHRKGAYTDRDHAVGLYALKDIVQVNVTGKGWLEGAVTTTRGLEYQVTFPDNSSAWASGPQIKYVRTPVAATVKTGVPPKPGFVSCAGKIEGRYASTGGFGNMTIVFKDGKASITAGIGDDEVLECWMLKDKIILRKPGAPEQDMPIDINNDGSLQTPLGELKKKGGF